MCYSMKPDRVQGYLTNAGWVLVGWKAVVIQRLAARPLFIRARWPGAFRTMNAHTGKPIFVGEKHTTAFKPRSLDADQTKHGFHITANFFQVVRAATEMARCCAETWARCSSDARTVLRSKHFFGLRFVRVLVPESDITENGHAKRIYMLPPRTRETAADIEAVERTLLREKAHQPTAIPEPVPEKA